MASSIQIYSSIVAYGWLLRHLGTQSHAQSDTIQLSYQFVCVSILFCGVEAQTIASACGTSRSLTIDLREFRFISMNLKNIKLRHFCVTTSRHPSLSHLVLAAQNLSRLSNLHLSSSTQNVISSAVAGLYTLWLWQMRKCRAWQWKLHTTFTDICMAISVCP